MSTESLKIMTVSLVDAKKFQAQAVYDGERLVIADVRPITGIFSTWKAPLIAEIKKRVADGYAVVIEEAGDTISQYGTQYLLDEPDEAEGKMRLQVVLDGYYEMESMGMLILAQEFKQFAIPKTGNEGGWIEKKNDEKGRAFYSINWGKLTGAHRAILLCVVVALQEPLSERFLHAMWGKPKAEEETHPWLRRRAQFAAMDIERGKELDRQREGR